MRLSLLSLLAASCALVPSVGFAIQEVELGNHEISAANYTSTPGLDLVVNQLTRTLYQDTNGWQNCQFDGDVNSLNACLRDFAKVQMATHIIVVRPAAGRYRPSGKSAHRSLLTNTRYMKMMEKRQRPQPATSGASVQWALAINPSWALELDRLKAAEPYLEIYVSDDLKLEDLVIPQPISILQVADMRERFSQAREAGSSKSQTDADRLLQALDAQMESGGEAYQHQLQRIASWLSGVTRK